MALVGPGLIGKYRASLDKLLVIVFAKYLTIGWLIRIGFAKTALE